jgi:di-N-acetylchitobiase
MNPERNASAGDGQRPPHRGPVTAGPNAPLPGIMAGLAQYKAAGVGAGRLVVGLPWYGYDYSCDNDTLRAPCAVRPQRPGQHSPQITYEDILGVLASGASPTGVMYDRASASAWLDYVCAGPAPPPARAPAYRCAGPGRHQIWFDTPGSLAVKYATLRRAGVRGVAWWHTGAVRYGSPQGGGEEMWDALTSFVDPRPLGAARPREAPET